MVVDPLSVASGIAGLIGLAELGIRTIYKFIETVKECRTEVRDLLLAVSDLGTILKSLQIVTEKFDALKHSGNRYPEAIDACSNALDRLRKKVEKCLLEEDGPQDKARSFRGAVSSVSKASKNFGHRARWVLTKEEVRDTIAELERYKSTFSLALSVDSVPTLFDILGQQEKISETISNMRQIQMEERSQRISKDERKMIHSFSSVDPTRRYRTLIKQRHQNTGLWLLDSDYYKDFVKDTGTSLWLYGKPGAGKSTLAAVVVEHLESLATEDFAAAAFFCEYYDPATHSISNILGSFAVQLAKQNDDALAILLDFYQDNTQQYDTMPDLDPERLSRLVQDLASCFEKAILVIDGLDECQEDREATFEALAQLNSDNEGNISIICFSRKDVTIEQIFNDFESQSIAANSSDIRLYVAAQLESRFKTGRAKDSQLKTDILTKLVERADGMFQWIKCQVDYLATLSSDRERRKALDSLPPSLPATYERILAQCLKEIQDAPVTLQNIRNTLLWIAFSRVPMSKDEVMTALAVESAIKEREDDDGSLAISDLDIEEFLPNPDKILGHLCGLVEETPNGDLQFSHFSVREYLERTPKPGEVSALSTFHIGTKDQKSVAKGCLQLLLMDVKKTEELNSDFQDYVAEFWADHCRGFLGDEDMLELALEFFSPEKRPNMQHWGICWYKIWDDSVTEDEVRDLTPVHFASSLLLAPVLEHFLADESYQPNKRCILGLPLDYVMQTARTSPPSDLSHAEEVVRLLIEAGEKAHGSSMDLVYTAIRIQAFGIAKHLLKARALLSPAAIKELAALKREGHEAKVAEFLQSAVPDAADGSNFGIRTESSIEENESEIRRVGRRGTQLEATNGVQTADKMALFASKSGLLPNLKASLRQLGLNSLDPLLLARCLRGAAKYGHIEIVEYLLSVNADPCDQNGRRKASALHTACFGINLPIVKILVEHCNTHGRPLPPADRNGSTLVWYACNAGSLPLVEYLVQIQGREALFDKSVNDLTTLHQAAKVLDPPLVKYLLAEGVKPIVAKTGETPLAKMILSLDEDSANKSQQLLALQIFDLLLPYETSLDTHVAKDRNLIHCIFSAAPEIALEMWNRIRREKRFDSSLPTAIADSSYGKATPLHHLLRDLIKLTNDKRARELLVRQIWSDALVDTTHVDAHGRTLLLWMSDYLDQFLQDRDNAKPGDTTAVEYLEAVGSLMELLLEFKSSKAIINVQNDNGETALHRLARCGSEPRILYIIEKLIDSGADPTIRDHNGDNPLMYAAREVDDNSETILHILDISKGRFNFDLDKPDRFKYTLLHYISGNRGKKTKDLIQKFLLPIATSTVKAPGGHIPLHFAATALDDFETAERLVQLAGSLISVENDRLEDCFRIACGKGYVSMVKAIIEHTDKTVDTPLRFLDDERRVIEDSPLIAAALESQTEVVNYLLEHGANTNARSSQGSLFLHALCGLKNPDLLKHLSKLIDADFNAHSVIRYNTNRHEKALPIHEAALSGVADTIDWLATAGRTANVDAVTSLGWTALHFAAASGDRDKCEALLNAGASIETKTSHSGETAFIIAVAAGKRSVCQSLIAKGVNVNARDIAGNTALHHAARSGDPDSVKYLLDAGCDPTLVNANRATAYDVATESGYLYAAAVLEASISRRLEEEDNGSSGGE